MYLGGKLERLRTALAYRFQDWYLVSSGGHKELLLVGNMGASPRSAGQRISLAQKLAVMPEQESNSESQAKFAVSYKSRLEVGCTLQEMFVDAGKGIELQYGRSSSQ